jgi:hypothetical protein
MDVIGPGHGAVGAPTPNKEGGSGGEGEGGRGEGRYVRHGTCLIAFSPDFLSAFFQHSKPFNLCHPGPCTTAPSSSLPGPFSGISALHIGSLVCELEVLRFFESVKEK